MDFYHGSGSGSGTWDMLMASGALAFSGVGQTAINVSNFPSGGSGGYTDDLIDFNPTATGDVANANNFYLENAPANSQLEIVVVNGLTDALALVVNGGGGPREMVGCPYHYAAPLAAGALGLLMYAWRKRR